MKKENRNLGLDLFRGICGYGVAICHFQTFLFNNSNYEYFSYLFVEFFFVLSGFVLYSQLIKVSDSRENLIIFFKRRWLRTLPLYLIFLTIVSILFDEFFSKDYFKYFFFIQKSLPNLLETDFYPIAWSLSIEEFFYLLCPLIFLIVKKNYIRIFLLLIFFFLVLKLYFCNVVDSNFFRTGTFLRLDSILFGFIMRHYYMKFNKISYIIIFNLIFWVTFIFLKEYFLANSEEYFSKITLILLMQVISCFTLILFFKLNFFTTNNFVVKFFKLISFQTYSIYLMHFIFLYIISGLEISRYFAMILYVSLLFVFSSIIYFYIEKPILKLRPNYK